MSVFLLTHGLRRMPQFVDGFVVGNRVQGGEAVKPEQRDNLVLGTIARVQPERLEI